MKFPYLVHRRYNTTTLPDIGRVNIALLLKEFEFRMVNGMAQLSLKQGKLSFTPEVIEVAKNVATRALHDSLLVAYRPK